MHATLHKSVRIDSALGRHVPAAFKTSAIALYALLSGGIFMFGGIQLGGALYRGYAPGGFLAMAFCALCAIPLIVYSDTGFTLRQAFAEAAGLTALAVFVRRQARIAYPLLDLGLFKGPHLRHRHPDGTGIAGGLVGRGLSVRHLPAIGAGA